MADPGTAQGSAVEGDLGLPEFVRFAHVAVRKERVRQLPATPRICLDLDEIES